MKIVIATYCLGYNYGAILQSLATVEIFRSLGHQPTLINQHQPWSFDPNLTNLRSYVSLNLRTLVKKWRMIIKKIILHQKFSKTWKEYPLTEYFGTSIDNIVKNPPECDVLITGSDQTWNTSATRPDYAVYFLPFSEKVKKISFASSLGGIKFKEEDKDWIISRLKSYSAISVREKNDVEYLKSIGIDSVKQIADPTIIVEKGFYEGLIRNERHKEYEGFIYLLGNDSVKHQEKIKDILKSNNINIKNVLNIPLHDFKLKGAKNRILTVKEWVDNLAHSKMVITDSFHAVVFSLLFNRPFVYLSFSDKDKIKNSRVESLLSGTSEMYRIVNIQDAIDLKNYDVKPHFMEKLLLMRETGINFLKDNI